MFRKLAQPCISACLCILSRAHAHVLTREALTVLRDRVYRFGAKYAPSDFLRRLTGSTVPDAAPFLRYLREKHLGEK